jgi:ornithine cyclodeaminase/alanine dehydrogenase-like protein (mu-crystallin family)
VLPVAAVHLDDRGLVTIGVGIRAGATECLGQVSGESLDMLGVEAVAERMADHVVSHHPTMPGTGKTSKAIVATRCLEDSLHASITSHKPLLGTDDVSPGTFIAAVGADNPEKQELHPALMAKSKIVVDILEQCASMGDLHHAIAAGVVTRADVHAELGEIVAGIKPGRESDEEITIFDSTGMALQDVAAAAFLYEKAQRQGCGIRLNFAA